MLYPSLETVKEMANSYKLVPVFFEIISDTLTPIHVYKALSENADTSFIIESVNNSEQWGRYSYIGMNPKEEIKIEKADEKTLPYLTEIIKGYKSPSFDGKPNLTGGLIGFFSYDSARSGEKKLRASYEKNFSDKDDDTLIPDVHLFLYDELIAFDHLANKTIIIANIRADKNGDDIERQYNKAEIRAMVTSERIKSYTPTSQPQNSTACAKDIKITSNLTKEEYEQNVINAKEHIANGDIFQIVLSQRFEIDSPPPPFNVYRMLRMTNPSPYLYYFKTPEYSFAGASPEMLVSVKDVNGVKTVKNRPIAGTRNRGETENEDLKLEENLRGDPKELAEHNMLVDLGRNDLGKVCKFGTVEVTDYMRTERYSKVMHLVSDVQGELDERVLNNKPAKTPLDALMAVLPAGTLTGAPKIRAMELIDEFENQKRGLYGGTIGYLGFDGEIDTCIAIRTVLFKNNKAYIQAGAGIVADSIPENEYKETQGKAAAIINAVKGALSL